jgi:hypothetical protein
LISPGKRFFSSFKPASDCAFPSCRKPTVQRALIYYTLLKIHPYLSLRYSVSVIPSLSFLNLSHFLLLLSFLPSLIFLFVAGCCCCSSSSSSSSSSFVPLSWVLYPYFWRSRNEKLQKCAYLFGHAFLSVCLSLTTTTQRFIQFECVKVNLSLSVM